MADALSMQDLTALRGETVYDRSGDKIGKVEEIFYDADTNKAEWIGVGTGIFSTKRLLVPVEGASTSSDGVTVPYDKDHVKDAPDVHGDEISEDFERQLYSYYGISSSDARSQSTLPDAGAGYADTTADADLRGTGTRDSQTGLENVEERSIVRSEEELQVGKRQTEAGRVRVRKWVETQPVEAQVELQRETVHVNREPLNERVSGGQIGDETLEVETRAEEAVVGKQTVAKERIGIDKDVVRETQTVSDEVRKERVDIDGADDITR